MVVEKLLFSINASCMSHSDFDLGVEIDHNSVVYHFLGVLAEGGDCRKISNLLLMH